MEPIESEQDLPQPDQIDDTGLPPETPEDKATVTSHGDETVAP